MDDVLGIAAALAVIALGLAVFVTLARRSSRALAASGYDKTDAVDADIERLANSLFGAGVTELYARTDANGPSWLAYVDAGDSESSGCAMIVYRKRSENGSSLVLLKSYRQIPKLLRRLEGGLFTWTEPLNPAEMTSLAGTGWFAHAAPSRDVPTAFKERLFGAARLPQSRGLLGIAAVDPYLAVWCDAQRINTLLAAAPAVRAATR